MTHPGGRPTDYDIKYNEMAYIACREGGFTDIKLAKLFSTCKSTIYVWKNTYPKFMDSIKKGKLEYDNENVKNSLLKRANGYQYTETTKKNIPIKIKVKDLETGKETGEEIIEYKLIVTKKIKKDIAPDTGACIAWLTNRQPEEWSRNGKDSEKAQPVIINANFGKKAE